MNSPRSDRKAPAVLYPEHSYNSKALGSQCGGWAGGEPLSAIPPQGVERKQELIYIIPSVGEQELKVNCQEALH